MRVIATQHDISYNINSVGKQWKRNGIIIALLSKMTANILKLTMWQPFSKAYIKSFMLHISPMM